MQLKKGKSVLHVHRVVYTCMHILYTISFPTYIAGAQENGVQLCPVSHKAKGQDTDALYFLCSIMEE